MAITGTQVLCRHLSCLNKTPDSPIIHFAIIFYSTPIDRDNAVL